MNIALSAVLIALLLIPGALFRIAYNRGTFKRSAVGFNPLGEDLAAVIFSNIVIYPLALTLQWKLIQSAPPYHVLVPLLTGNYGKESVELVTIKNYLYSPPINDLVAFVAICSVSWLLGFCTHWLVRRFNLDRKIRFLRFTSNEWYYTLYPIAEPLDGVKPKVHAIIALDLKNETYLYRGEIEDYWLERNGALERIELKNAVRRKLSSDGDDAAPDSSKWYPIRSQNLIVKYADCRSIAVAYALNDESKAFSDEEIKRVVENETVLDFREATSTTVLSAEQTATASPTNPMPEANVKP